MTYEIEVSDKRPLVVVKGLAGVRRFTPGIYECDDETIIEQLSDIDGVTIIELAEGQESRAGEFTTPDPSGALTLADLKSPAGPGTCPVCGGEYKNVAMHRERSARCAALEAEKVEAGEMAPPVDESASSESDADGEGGESTDHCDCDPGCSCETCPSCVAHTDLATALTTETPTAAVTGSNEE